MRRNSVASHHTWTRRRDHVFSDFIFNCAKTTTALTRWTAIASFADKCIHYMQVPWVPSILISISWRWRNPNKYIEWSNNHSILETFWTPRRCWWLRRSQESPAIATTSTSWMAGLPSSPSAKSVATQYTMCCSKFCWNRKTQSFCDIQTDPDLNLSGAL